jgi:hypothetical protein
MGRLSRQARTGIIVAAAVLLVCAGWVKLTLWQSNRISPQFLSVARSTYRSIRECDDRISEEGSAFPACITKAENAVASLPGLAITQRERMEYAFLLGYLMEVRDGRRDWELSDVSTDAKERHKQLFRFRLRLEKTYQTN